MNYCWIHPLFVRNFHCWLFKLIYIACSRINFGASISHLDIVNLYNCSFMPSHSDSMYGICICHKTNKFRWPYVEVSPIISVEYYNIHLLAFSIFSTITLIHIYIHILLRYGLCHQIIQWCWSTVLITPVFCIWYILSRMFLSLSAN